MDASADEHGLTIDTSGTVRFRIHAAGLVQSKLTEPTGIFPGVTSPAQTDAKDSTVEAGRLLDVVYNGMNHMRLSVQGARIGPMKSTYSCSFLSLVRS